MGGEEGGLECHKTPHKLGYRTVTTTTTTTTKKPYLVLHDQFPFLCEKKEEEK
jgi:hypothetical protein